MTRPTKLSRRGFLYGAGATALTAPFWRVLGSRAAVFPKRLVLVFSPNGTIHDAWRPTGGETDFRLGPILEPLNEFRDRLVILDGIDQVSSLNGPGDGHQRGMGHLWTGTELLEGTEFVGGGGGTSAGWAGGISVDQYVANAIGDSTRFRSLEFGVQCRRNTVWSRMCYRGPNAPLAPMEDPYAAFDRIFADIGASSGVDVDAIRRRGQSVIDYVRGDIERLTPRLGAEDRARLEAHLTAVRGLERRLSTDAPGAACVAPELGAGVDPNRNGDFPRLCALQTDLLATAFACDLTRVASLQFSKSVGGVVFDSLGISQSHHDLSHNANGNAEARAKLIQINRWFAERVRDLLRQLDAVPEGEGTMLDNTLVVWGNELGDGDRHQRESVPFVLAGGAGGALRGGRYLQYDGAAHNDLLVSIANAMGVPTTTFGNPRYCSGPLSRLI